MITSLHRILGTELTINDTLGRMKKTGLLLSLLLSLSYISAEAWEIAAGWRTSLQEGQFNEIVYAYNEGERYILSHLFWDMTGFITTGPWIKIKKNRWILSGNYYFPANGGTGYMEDYDWLSISSFSGLNDLEGIGVEFDEWTDYSLSRVNIEEYQDYQFQIGYALDQQPRSQLILHLGFRALKIKWDDDLRYWIHTVSSYDYRGDVQVFEGQNAIDYEWNSSGIQMGFSISGKPLPWLNLHTDITFSPWDKRYSKDFHYNVNSTTKAGVLYIDYFLQGSQQLNLDLEGQIQMGSFILTTGYELNYFFLYDRDTITQIYTLPNVNFDQKYINAAGTSGEFSSFYLRMGYLF